MTSTFAGLGVPDDLCRLLEKRGIESPFPIQSATLPDALAGRDICGRAPTGSGKTLAFGLAIAALSKPGKPRRPTTLVLVPTRELASQVAGELKILLRQPGQKRNAPEDVVALYGGTGYGPQRRALQKGGSIVVACPGRLEDLLEQGDLVLSDVQQVVLDEADRMADMGFLPAVRRLLDQTSRDRQTLLFSATLDKDVDVVVRKYQTNPAHHSVASSEEDPGDVSHKFWKVDRPQRVDVVAALVRHHGKAVVFCRTKHGADRLTKQLTRVGVGARAVHGNRSQSQREKALAAFSRGRAGALVATDVAARGIHVDDVACVIHFDIPTDPKDYIHRSGRTGRAGADGAVVSLVVDQQHKQVRGLQRALDLPTGLGQPDLPQEAFVATAPIPPEASERSSDQSQRRSQPSGRNRKPRHQGSRRHEGGGGSSSSPKPSRSHRKASGGHSPEANRNGNGPKGRSTGARSTARGNRSGRPRQKVHGPRG